MVFSSIKPEKRFSQWRGEGERRRRAGTGCRSDTENKRFALPLVCVCVRSVWKVEKGEEGEARRGRSAALCEANEERPGSRDHASDSHVLHRRPMAWPPCKHIFAEIHTFKQRQKRGSKARLVNKADVCLTFSHSILIKRGRRLFCCPISC